MKTIVARIFFILSPLISFLLFVLTFGYHSNVSSQNLQLANYPPPVSPTVQDRSEGREINSAYSIYIPITQKGWEYPDIPTPIHSYSLYLKTVNEDELFNAGCEQGYRDWGLAGTQNSIIFLDFGRPNDFGYDQYGTILHDFITPATTSQIAYAVYKYGLGYYQCTGIDTSSKIIIAIGTNNDSDYDVTYEHGRAWAQMVLEADSFLAESIRSQVGFVAASNMELEFDDPTSTIAWVNGYNDNSQYPFRLYNVGNASGCPPYGSCGDPNNPDDWTQEDVWYISYGCRMCYPLPMVYSNNWANAEQWQHIAKYAYEIHNQECMSFRGVVTQNFACSQRPEDQLCPYLDNTPEQGFKQLYEVLTVDPITNCCADYLNWTTDMKWWGE